MAIVGVGAQLRELDRALAAPCMIVCTDPMRVLTAAQEAFGEHSGWDWQMTDAGPETTWPAPVAAAVKRFGWPGSWWHVISPSGFFAKPASRRWTAKALEAWGHDYADWCRTNDLPMVATRGAMGSRLLRDVRFFPRTRRIVPRFLNDVGRAHLPGNYYDLVAARAEHAVYWDQAGAYHFHALAESCPDPDDLHASGDPLRQVRRIDPESRAGRRMLAGHGLLLAELHCPAVERTDFPPPWWNPEGGLTWIFSNELPMLYALGGSIIALVACYASPNPWSGLQAYARWATAALSQASPERLEWLKPTLLATYGVLAAKPRPALIRSPRKGREGLVVYLPNGMTGVQRQSREQSPVTHTIALGMVQAATRRESLNLARKLGGAVVGIYSDAVIASPSTQSLAIGAPEDRKTGMVVIENDLWRQKQILTNYARISSNAYASNEETKHPGHRRTG